MNRYFSELETDSYRFKMCCVMCVCVCSLSVGERACVL